MGEFDGEGSDIGQLGQQAAGNGFGLGLERSGCPRSRCPTDAKNAVAVLVLCQRMKDHFAVLATR